MSISMRIMTAIFTTLHLFNLFFQFRIFLTNNLKSLLQYWVFKCHADFVFHFVFSHFLLSPQVVLAIHCHLLWTVLVVGCSNVVRSKCYRIPISLSSIGRLFIFLTYARRCFSVSVIVKYSQHSINGSCITPYIIFVSHLLQVCFAPVRL